MKPTYDGQGITYVCSANFLYRANWHTCISLDGGIFRNVTFIRMLHRNQTRQSNKICFFKMKHSGPQGILYKLAHGAKYEYLQGHSLVTVATLERGWEVSHMYSTSTYLGVLVLS